MASRSNDPFVHNIKYENSPVLAIKNAYSSHIVRNLGFQASKQGINGRHKFLVSKMIYLVVLFVVNSNVLMRISLCRYNIIKNRRFWLLIVLTSAILAAILDLKHNNKT